MPNPSYLVYVRLPAKVADRLSYGENHPEREALYTTLANAQREGFDLRKIETVAKLLEDDVDPGKEYPEQLVLYLGLEGIESNTGKAVFHSGFGKDIHSTAKRFHRGNIVFAGLRPYLNKAHLVQVEEALGSAELFVMLPDKEQVIPEFLLSYLLSDLVLNQTKWILTGSSYPRLAGRDFKNLMVILPTKTETQSAILNGVKPFKDEAECKRAGVDRLKDECRNVILEALKIVMPSPRRFEPSSRCYFISCPNQYPERLDLIYHHPWMNQVRQLLGSLKTIKLEGIIEPRIDYGITASGKDQGLIPFLNIENLRPDGRINIANIRYIDSAEDTELVHANDILVSRSRLVGCASLVTESEDGFSFGSYILRMRVKKNAKIPAEYIVSFLNSDLGQAQFRLLETGSFGKNINTRQLKDIDIALPIKDEAIDDLVSSINKQWGELTAFEEQADTAWSVARREFTNLLLKPD